MTIDKEGKKHIWWNPFLTNGVRNCQNSALYSEHYKLPDSTIYNANKKIEWNIEYAQRNEDGYSIAGWIFCNGNDHYKYDKQLILKSSDGTMTAFRVFDQERVDVAVTFPEIHYLYNTGFICNVWEKNLEKGMTYDIIMRLENQFDSSDIQDVLTGCQIIG